MFRAEVRDEVVSGNLIVDIFGRYVEVHGVAGQRRKWYLRRGVGRVPGWTNWGGLVRWKS
jgi:hypothetical protein